MTNTFMAYAGMLATVSSSPIWSQFQPSVNANDVEQKPVAALLRHYCPRFCTSKESLICGSNMKTYLNMCKLRQDRCEFGSHILVEHKGPCKQNTAKLLNSGPSVRLPSHEISFKFPGHFRNGLIDTSLRGDIPLESFPTPGEEECPEIDSCSHELEPICGDDGITYPNICLLKASACLEGRIIGQLYFGVCSDHIPPGYTNDPDDEKFNEDLTEDDLLLSASSPTNVLEPLSTGSNEETDYDDDPYFAEVLRAQNTMISDDAPSSNIEVKDMKNCPLGCGNEVFPVCGSDDKQYLNKCKLDYERCYYQPLLKVKKLGPCSDIPRVRPIFVTTPVPQHDSTKEFTTTLTPQTTTTKLPTSTTSASTTIFTTTSTTTETSTTTTTQATKSTSSSFPDRTVTTQSTYTDSHSAQAFVEASGDHFISDYEFDNIMMADEALPSPSLSRPIKFTSTQIIDTATTEKPMFSGSLMATLDEIPDAEDLPFLEMMDYSDFMPEVDFSIEGFNTHFDLESYSSSTTTTSTSTTSTTTQTTTSTTTTTTSEELVSDSTSNNESDFLEDNYTDIETESITQLSFSRKAKVMTPTPSLLMADEPHFTNIQMQTNTPPVMTDVEFEERAKKHCEKKLCSRKAQTVATEMCVKTIDTGKYVYYQTRCQFKKERCRTRLASKKGEQRVRYQKQLTLELCL